MAVKTVKLLPIEVLTGEFFWLVLIYCLEKMLLVLAAQYWAKLRALKLTQAPGK